MLYIIISIGIEDTVFSAYVHDKVGTGCVIYYAGNTGAEARCASGFYMLYYGSAHNMERGIAGAGNGAGAV